MSVASKLIEAKASTARDELFAAGLVRHTPFGPRVGVHALREWISSLPIMTRTGELLPAEAETPPPVRHRRRGRP